MTRPDLIKDTVGSGLALGLGSIAATALLLTLGIVLFGQSPADHLRWYAACFVPPLLLLRHTVKLQFSTASKTLMVLLFITFIPFIIALFRTNALTMQ